MSGCGNIMANGGGLEALLKAAKFVEEQEKQELKRQNVTPRFVEDSNELKELPKHNGIHPQLSSRIPTPPTLPKHGSVIKKVHVKLEKNRRDHLRQCFETLKKHLPPAADDKKTYNVSILQNAIRYIAVLKSNERDFENEVERLAQEKIAYQQKLTTLKKELEDIDLNKLLPEMVEYDPMKTSNFMNGLMTETGSEEMVITSTMSSSTSSLLGAVATDSPPPPP